MDRQKLLKVVNPVMALAFLSSAAGGLTRFFAPSVIPYDTFRKIHPIFGLVLVACVICHLVLNWNWIKAVYLKKK